MPPPPPRGAPPKPMSSAPALSSTALAAIRKKIAEPVKINRQDVADNDESFRDDEDTDRDRSRYAHGDTDNDNDGNYRNYSREHHDRILGREGNYENDDKYDDHRGQDEDDAGDDDGDGYGDGYGPRGGEYDDSYMEDDRAFDDRDRDDSYLDEVNTAPLAQPKSSTRSEANNRDLVRLDRFKTPYEYKEGSQLPYSADTPEIFNFRHILKATYRELRNFVLSPVEPGKVVRCYIERNRSGSNMLSPFYSLCADLEDGTGRELMVCKKAFYSMQSHHIFSLKGEDLYRKREQRSRLYLGKLRADGDKSEFVLYDNGSTSAPADGKEEKYSPGSGEDPDYSAETYLPGAVDVEEQLAAQAKAGAKDDGSSLYRKELCVIQFNTKKRPAPAGVRGSEIAIPATYLNANTQAFNNANMQFIADKNAQAKSKGQSPLVLNTVPLTPNSSISNPFSRCRAAGKQNEKQTKHVFVMHERTSKYDPLSSCLVDFKSRANIASTKNAQYIESSPQDAAASTDKEYEQSYILQIGKTTEDCFNVDVRYPLTLLQAFAICVSRFDAKITW